MLAIDRTQLIPMALKAQEATGNAEITVLADRGYFNGDQVLACENTGVLPCVQTTGRSTAVNALTSHCDSGPASILIRPKVTPSEVRRAMIAAGSVGTFCLQDHLAGIVDHAHRGCLHRPVQTNEMNHLILLPR
jgi:hypothetical protein